MIPESIIFCCFVLLGAFYSYFLCLVKFVKMFLKNRIINVLFQIINVVVLFVLFYVLNLYLNMGQIRLYTYIGFLLGFGLYKITFYKILDNLHKLFYNKLTRLSGIKYTKLGTFILK